MPRWIPLTDAQYIEQYKSKCIITASGCWEWQGWKCKPRGCTDRSRGYPEGSYRGRKVRVTRQMLEMTQGKLEPGEVACHTCDNPPCINPDHLFIGTQKDNIRDGIAKGHQQFHPSHYTHCKNGHEFNAENMRVGKHGYRHCRTCERIRQRIEAGWTREEAEALPPIPPGEITKRRSFNRLDSK